MAFIVETGSGTPGANAYASVAFVDGYLSDRNRSGENSWSAAVATAKQAAIIAATDYIEGRWGPRFKGGKALRLVDGRQASGKVTFSGLPAANDTLTVGLKTYSMVSALVQENDVLIGADIAATVANLVSALAGEGLDTVVEEHTLSNYEASGVDQSPDLVVVARTKGESGNLVAFSGSLTNATISGSGFLEDGLDEGEQPLSFPRRGLYSRDGRLVIGVPLKLKQATAEYAVRSLAAVLSPDPKVDARLAPVQSTTVRAGSVEKSVTYAAGGQPVVNKPYPAADRLLSDYVTAAGGVIR